MFGQKLLELRKRKNLSQEEAAEKLNVTRQTISKWETNQSVPDLSKVAGICELYGISASELIDGTKEEIHEDIYHNELNDDERRNRYAKGIGIGVFLYFIAIVIIMVMIPVLRINPIVSSAVFLLVCGIATYYIIYTAIVYKKKMTPEEKEVNGLRKQINNVVLMIFLIIYLLVSFITGAWYITWILWIIYFIVIEIIKLLFMLRGNGNEK